MKNVHLIATDKPSRLFEIDGHLIINREQLIQFKYCRNIYITSDEVIKEGYWFLTSDNKTLKCEKFLMGLIYSEGDYGRNPNCCQKIILTTDQSLIQDGVQSIPDEFLQWFVKNPSCEFVEFEKWTDYEFENDKEVPFFNYKIILKNKQENLTLTRIKEIVDQTKDLTPKEQTSVAYSLPITACALYVLQMKSKYGIKVSI